MDEYGIQRGGGTRAAAGAERKAIDAEASKRMEGMTIGKVAERAGVHVETVRFYERRGLIRQPPRPASGYRRYSPAVVQRIRFIRHAKELGFTLEEIAELLSLRAAPGRSCDEVKERAERKVDDVRSRIDRLRDMEAALLDLIETCKRDGTTSECPILEALDGEEPW